MIFAIGERQWYLRRHRFEVFEGHVNLPRRRNEGAVKWGVQAFISSRAKREAFVRLRNVRGKAAVLLGIG